uniref:Uncharacterized protein n=1 Tax=Oryza brachyantha TaxID=4533 RepID=J3N1R2_ORYBR
LCRTLSERKLLEQESMRPPFVSSSQVYELGPESLIKEEKMKAGKISGVGPQVNTAETS